MNRVILTYNGTDAVIHGSKINQNAFIKEGELREYVNAIPTFSFKVFPNNPGYDSIEDLLTKISVTSFDQTENIFVGRVYSTADMMQNDGLIYKIVGCEGELAYLQDVVISSYNVYAGTLLSSALTSLLNSYNAKVPSDKRMTLSGGNTTAVPTDYSASYKTAFDILKDICDLCEWEYRVSYNDGTRYLEVAQQFGSKSDTDIALSVNLKSLKREIKANDIVTHFYPLGIVKDSGGYFTIAPDNAGIPYLANATLEAKYGVIEAAKIYDDITIESMSSVASGAKKLKAKAKKDYSNMIGLLTSFTLSALDLSLINGNYNDLKLYNTHRVVTKLQSIDEEVRITGRTLKLDDPQNPALTFGVKQATLTSMVARG
jgi:phage minor structural protein